MKESRISAVTCLGDILKKKGKPKQSLDQFAQTLDRRDRAFVMEIVYGVLRNLYVLDGIISQFIKNTRPLGVSTINNLRIALYQMLFMRVPDFAVVHEAVKIEKPNGKPSLVNAVLRNVIRKRETIKLHMQHEDPALEIAINTSHPEWLIRRWILLYGVDETRTIAEINNSKAPLTLRTNTLRISRQDLLEELRQANIPARPTACAPDGLVLGEGVSYQDIFGFHGLFAVQDEASQLISYLLSPNPGERILDACAAPGGKTTHIAQLMKDRGEIIAVEKNPFRARILAENIRSLGLRSVQLLQSDLAEIQITQKFDRILLDAPCSSVGVIRRNPDVRYRHMEKDMVTFSHNQTLLMNIAAQLLKKDGRLVYSVCSTDPIEGEHVIQNFLKTACEFRIIETDQEFLAPYMKNGFFRTYPHKHAMDGFFGVILCKKT